MADEQLRQNTAVCVAVENTDFGGSLDIDACVSAFSLVQVVSSSRLFAGVADAA